MSSQTGTSFTDIFIRRPVLATVVSLLILLVGAQSGLKLQIRQYPELSQTTITITTAYPGANADLIKGFITTPIEQAVASAEGIDTLVSSSQQNVSTITLNLRLNASPDRARRRRALQDQSGQGPIAARRQRSHRREADGPGHGADVHLVQLESVERLADHRLYHPCRSAQIADAGRRRQRADPRRPDLRHAHLARSRQAWPRSA
jgi:hypothetical protein